MGLAEDLGKGIDRIEDDMAAELLQVNVEYLRRSIKLEVLKTSTSLEVRVVNTGAGHSIPTGVTDLRELWLEVTGLDAKGKVVYSSGVPNAAGNLEPDARIFHATLLDAQGRKLERHDIWRAAKLGKDTRIPADGSRLERFTLPTGVATVRVRLLWRDLPANFVAWVLKQNASSVKTHELLVWEDK